MPSLRWLFLPFPMKPNISFALGCYWMRIFLQAPCHISHSLSLNWNGCQDPVRYKNRLYLFFCISGGCFFCFTFGFTTAFLVFLTSGLDHGLNNQIICQYWLVPSPPVHHFKALADDCCIENSLLDPTLCFLACFWSGSNSLPSPHKYVTVVWLFEKTFQLCLHCMPGQNPSHL